MKSYFKIAWRNIWRVKNRTFITMFAIAVAVFLAIIMRGFQLGSYDLMMLNAVENYSGYIQVHKNGYWDDKTIDNVFQDSDSLRSLILQNEEVTDIIPQVNYNSLAAYELQSKGVIIAGLVPDVEDQRMNLRDKVVDGVFFNEEEGILIAEKLAEYLKIGVGDTLVLRSNGYHGVSADGIYPVKGIIRFPSPIMNSSFVIMELSSCQYFFDLDNMVTEYCINIDNLSKLDEVVADLRARLSDDYEIMPWYEIRPDLQQQIESDNASGLIFIGLLYLIIAFGVFGTIMMMTMERRKEFGVMVAVGMKRTKLVTIVALETFIIGVLGIIVGAGLSIPVNYYFYTNPIQLKGDMAAAMESYGVEPLMPFAWQPDYYYIQSYTVLVIVFVAILYPLSSILRLKVMNALRS